jgi:hypothetical protein
MGFLLVCMLSMMVAGCSAADEPVTVPRGEQTTAAVSNAPATSAGDAAPVDVPEATGAAFDIDNCAAAQGTSRRNDQVFDNQTLCYQARAEQLNDWASCLELGQDPSFPPAACLAGVTLRSQVYVCDKHGDMAVVQQCNEWIMVEAGATPTIHQIEGLQPHRVAETKQLGLGASFNVEGVAVEVNDEGLVVLPDYYPATSHLCRAHEDPPIAVGTGVQGAYVYVTGCAATDAGFAIDYFRYDLPGLIFPEHL